MKEIQLFYVPCPNIKVAEDLIDLLLEKKMIACGNILRSESVYFWEGEKNKESEWVAMLKTSVTHCDIVMETIEENHPYDTPAILTWSVRSNVAYAEWIEKTTNG